MQHWQDVPLSVAAQAVQRSAYLDAYAKYESDATLVVKVIASGTRQPPPVNPLLCLANCPTTVNTDKLSSATVKDCPHEIAVLTRAASWLTAWNGGPVPYLSSSDPATWFDGYRRDCSGYASMALGLTPPGLDTRGLAARSTPIQKTDLHPGDLLINPAPNNAGHAVIFDRWTDSAMTSYLGYEQSGDGGTHHRVIPYPYFGGYPMSPFRL